MICGESISNIIRQGRNQAMHYEMEPWPDVKSCFDNLNEHLPDDQKLYISKNMAKRILELLGWRDYGSYKKDMLSLA